MAAVQQNTDPAMAGRRMLHHVGNRCSLDRSSLPGRSDLVFGPRHKVVFVYGCSWLGHNCRKGRLPTSRVDYWSKEVIKNKAIDARDLRHLPDGGSQACIAWECEPADLDPLRRRLARFVDGGPS